jgi:predicted XRE-type DNA-binding protein
MVERLKMTRGSGNVFVDVGFDPEEAANLALRASLMNQVRDAVGKMKLTQVEAAKKIGLTQSRLNLLLKGHIHLFSIDALVNMLAKAGYRTDVRVKRLPVKRSARALA